MKMFPESFIQSLQHNEKSLLLKSQQPAININPTLINKIAAIELDEDQGESSACFKNFCDVLESIQSEIEQEKNAAMIKQLAFIKNRLIEYVSIHYHAIYGKYKLHVETIRQAIQEKNQYEKIAQEMQYYEILCCLASPIILAPAAVCYLLTFCHCQFCNSPNCHCEDPCCCELAKEVHTEDYRIHDGFEPEHVILTMDDRRNIPTTSAACLCEGLVSGLFVPIRTIKALHAHSKNAQIVAAAIKQSHIDIQPSPYSM